MLLEFSLQFAYTEQSIIQEHEMATKKKIADLVIPKDEKEKEAAIEAVLDTVNKKYGQGSLMKLGQQKNVAVDVISTGALTLDAALGVGGIPRGRISEIYGHEASGKTTLTLHVIAEAQKSGGNAAFIDAEHALDPNYAKALGVNVEDLYISQPDSGEEALDILDKIVSSSAFDVVVVDSVAALVSRAELAGEIGDSHVALQARLMSQTLRRITSITKNSNTSVIFINQTRQNISTTGYGAGTGETTTGGKALKFYSSVRIDVRRTEWIRKGEDTIGHKIKVKVVKNKLAPPFKIVQLEIIFGQGISREGLLIDLGLESKILSRSGAWFYLEGEQVAQGKERLRELIEKDDIFRLSLEIKIRKVLEMGSTDKLEAELVALQNEKTDKTGKNENPKDDGKKKDVAKSVSKDEEDPFSDDTMFEVNASK